MENNAEMLVVDLINFWDDMESEEILSQINFLYKTFGMETIKKIFNSFGIILE